jgi:hypothetical protein
MASYLFYDAYDSGALQTGVQTGNSAEVATGWNTRRENANQYSPQINGQRQPRNSFTSTTPTTTNGTFTYTVTNGIVSVTQGFITPVFNALNLPSGQWTINQEVRTETDNRNAAGRFVYFLFKVGSPATSSGTFSATAIPMYSDAALTTQISGPVQSSEATSIGTTAQNCSTTFYTDRIFLELEHFYLQVWWEITNRENTNSGSKIYYANGTFGPDDDVRVSYTNDPFNIESPEFKRKRFVIS